MVDECLFVSKGMGNAELCGGFVCGLLLPAGDRDDLKLLQRSQSWNVAVFGPAPASMMPTRILSLLIMFSLPKRKQNPALTGSAHIFVPSQYQFREPAMG
jgi:hypothetical protein